MTHIDVGSDHCRVVPPRGIEEGFAQFEFFRHLFAYIEAGIRISSNAHILEIGSGEGYGINYLSTQLPYITATDLSLQALRHAKASYPHIQACQTLGTNLPFASNVFEAAISFQVIEHITEANRYLEEIQRILRPGGTLFLTTPNRKLRLLPFQKPWNPYHVREYTGNELHRLLKHWFGSVEIYAVMTKPSLMALEKARVKQTPLRVGKKIIEKMFPGLEPKKWLRVVSNRPQRRSKWSSTIVELSDFFLSPDVDQGLDLFVIATKSD